MNLIHKNLTLLFLYKKINYMEIILDELYPVEFFNHGGVVKLTVINDCLMKDYSLKKKYTFFDYKSYNRFFRNIYLSYMHNHPELNSIDVYKFINSCVEFNSYIGNSLYVVDLEYDNLTSYETAKFYYSGDKKFQELAPRDPYGIKNVNFTLIDENDDRWDIYKKQRLEQGFDDSELWSLDGTISKFIYPRLKLFYENVCELGCYPASMTFEKWKDILKRMVDGFELLADDRIKTDEEKKKENDALDLMCEYFYSLWT